MNISNAPSHTRNPGGPKISVITVCFNSAATIGDAIESVAHQSWSHVEHIVIDGASTDMTLSVIGPYRSRLAHVVSEPDRGIYDAMNKGLALASGDVICFLNADDLYAHQHVLTDVIQLMERHKLDALFGDVVFFRSAAPEKIVRRYRSHHFHPAGIASGWMPAHPALFVRKAVFERVGGFRDNYRIAGDFEFVARAFGKGDLHYQYLPEVLVKMRLGGVSTAGWRSRLLLNKEVLRACRENGIRTNMLKILSKYPAKLLEMLRR